MPDNLTTTVRAADIVAVLKQRARTRLSLTWLAHEARVPPKLIKRYLATREVRSALTKFGWRISDSRALSLPMLERHPYSVPMLVRERP